MVNSGAMAPPNLHYRGYATASGCILNSRDQVSTIDKGQCYCTLLPSTP